MFFIEWMALGELLMTCVVDFLLYVLVDKVVKTPLGDAGDIEEKRVIWLYESIVLLTLSFFIYAFHHTPFTLLSMTIATFVYTQMLGRVNFRQWWMKVTTLFDEFEQHEESMEKLQELKQQQQLAQQANMSSNSNMPRWPPPNPMMSHIPPIMAENQANSMPDFSAPAEAWYPADVEREKMKSSAANWPVYSESQGVYSSAPSVAMAAPQLRHRGPPATVSQQFYYPGQTAFYSRLPEKFHNGPRYTSVTPRGSELTRRPLHAFPQNQKATIEEPQGKLSFTSKVLSAFGMDPYNKTPPGLPNSGNNLCFMNSVLQCLANCPSLIESLTNIEDLKSCTMPEAVMVTSLRDLLKKLTEKPGTTDVKVVDTKEFRNAISSLPGSIVVNPVMNRQSQQDSAELLMWLLHVLHDALNTSKNQTNNNGSITGLTHNNPESPRQQGSPKYTSAKINMLKYIYGDLTLQRIKELKDACKKEIESSNRLEGNSYAEPVQRLSDLEWLTYKEQNNSAIDDLFTGQLVEAQHCTACNRLSVSIQTFNILPVPIVEPRDFNGLVYLEDCLTKFGTTESLYGPDGLRCECSNAPPSATTMKNIPKPNLPFTPIDNNAKVTVQSPSKWAESPALPNGGGSKDVPRRRLLGNIDNAPRISGSVMSPIPNSTGDILNDSGFSDTHFRTSTPIRGQNAPIKLTDGERRSLLRQLPEYLILQVLRFTYHNGQPRKIHRPISIPLTNLDMTEQIVDKVMKREDLTALNACYKYDLCGLCVHLGGDGNFSGHYISYSIASDGLWYKYDDENVTAVNMEYEINTKAVRENAYLLFYKKSQGR